MRLAEASLSFGKLPLDSMGQSQGITVALFSPGAVMPCRQHTTFRGLRVHQQDPFSNDWDQDQAGGSFLGVVRGLVGCEMRRL